VNASVVSASTIKFTASAGGVDLGGIDLGLGGFLGGLTGQLVSGSYNTIIGGVALGTGVTALVNSRNNLATNPPPGGNISSFTTINGTTQLQFSTIGTNLSTYYRFTDSGGSDPSLRPGLEVFVSSIIAPGTLCLRSLSDPINPANPSTFTSTLQSFGQWVPVPAATSSVPPVIVASTINVSTMIVRGQAPAGVVLAVPQGNVQVGGVSQGVTLTNGGGITANSINLIAPGTRTLTCVAVNTTNITSPGVNTIGGVTIGSPSGQLTATNINATTFVGTTASLNGVSLGSPSGRVTAADAIISGTVAATNLSTIQSINGGQVYAVSGRQPAFNSSSAPQIFAPFEAAGPGYIVNLNIITPCIVRVLASITSASTQETVGFGPMGAWDVVIGWDRNPPIFGGLSLRAFTVPIYALGMTLSGDTEFAPFPGFGLLLMNTSGTTYDGVQVSWHITSWSP
jgi:hypothetical protein